MFVFIQKKNRPAVTSRLIASGVPLRVVITCWMHITSNCEECGIVPASLQPPAHRVHRVSVAVFLRIRVL